MEEGVTPMDNEKSLYTEVILESGASIELAPKFGKEEVKLLEVLRAEHVKQKAHHKFTISVCKDTKYVFFCNFIYLQGV